MTLTPQWLGVLRCPSCGNGLDFRAARTPPRGAAEFGVLDCGCRLHPVIDGIPILLRAPVGMFKHQSGALAVDGVTPERLVRLLQTGREDEALSRCLSYAIAPPWLSRLLGARLAGGVPARHLTRWLNRRYLHRIVLSQRRRISACEVLRFFFQSHSPLGPDTGDYFVMRFGQPRHLAALAVLSALPADAKPLLDIACGAGHLAHYLTRRRAAARVIGVDINFFQLWIARHWIAPGADFVCCDVHDGLPFADDVFAATVCSDAYHYLRDRRALLHEVRRCAPDRTVVLTRAGNGAVGPNEGLELDVEGYSDEIGDRTLRVFHEVGLVRDYLARRNPLANPRDELAEARLSKWLSFVWHPPRDVRDPAWEEPDWPHAVGTLGWNPIYAPTQRPDGGLELRFRFPGIWFAFENAAMLSYHPRSVTLTRGEVAQLHRGATDSLAIALLRTFVLLGLPERYLGGAARRPSQPAMPWGRAP